MSERHGLRRFYESAGMPLALGVLFLVEIVWAINRSSTWFDESYSLVLVAPNSFAEIAHRTAVDGHPPLWYWTLKPWISVFGPSIVAARAMSACWMLGTFAAWYHFFKTRFSRPLAVLVLALTVTNPMLLHYAVEARMYALSLCLVAISCLLLTSRWRWRWYAYWPLGVAMLYIHYFLAFVIAAEFIYLLLRRKEQGVAIWFLLVYGASIVAAFAPWIPLAAHQTSRIVAGGFWIPPIAMSTYLIYVLMAFLHRIDPDLQGAAVFPATVYFVVWIAVFTRGIRQRGGEHVLLWCVAGVPWVCLFVLSCKPFVPIFHPRYVIFGLPCLIAILAAGALALEGRWRIVVIVVLMLGNLSGLKWMRTVGTNNERRNWNSMKWVARELAKPIDGEIPTVISRWQFAFFDAKVTLPASQTVRILRSEPPRYESTDAVYFDKRDWYVLDLNEVTTKHYWLIEDVSGPQTALPAGDHELRTSNRGYVRIRLIERMVGLY